MTDMTYSHTDPQPAQIIIPVGLLLVAVTIIFALFVVFSVMLVQRYEETTGGTPVPRSGQIELSLIE